MIIVRGAGDISTGTIHRLFRAGFPVLALETDRPSAIRRKVAFSEAVYDGTATVEDLTAVRIGDAGQAKEVLAEGKVPLLVDPAGESIRLLKPEVLVEALRRAGATFLDEVAEPVKREPITKADLFEIGRASCRERV